MPQVISKFAQLAALSDYASFIGTAASHPAGDFDAAGSAVTAAAAAIATALLKANNLSDLPSSSVARTNLGLGSAATHPSTDFDAAGAAAAVGSSLATHVADTANPHAVTKP